MSFWWTPQHAKNIQLKQVITKLSLTDLLIYLMTVVQRLILHHCLKPLLIPCATFDVIAVLPLSFCSALTNCHMCSIPIQCTACTCEPGKHENMFAQLIPIHSMRSACTVSVKAPCYARHIAPRCFMLLQAQGTQPFSRHVSLYLERLNSPLSPIPYVPLQGPSSGLSTSPGTFTLQPLLIFAVRISLCQQQLYAALGVSSL